MPWWVATVATATGALCAVAAAGQRAGMMPLALLLIATVLALVSILVFAATGQVVRPWQKSIAVLAAAMILLAHPVVPDFAPVPLVVLAADVAVTAHPALSITVAAIGIAEIGASAWWAGLIGFPVYAVAVLLGLAGGSTMRWYIRALHAERMAREAGREQAILAERQRIAREVHDVVGHTLSITLLHLTGAR